MRLPVATGTNQERSLTLDARRTLNYYIEVDQEGREPAALYGRAGLADFAEVGDGAIRGTFTSTSNGRFFVVSGSELYEVDSAGSGTLIGTLNQSSGNVSFAENSSQLAICDGVTLYLVTYSTDAFAEVVDGDFPGAETVEYIGGYFVVNPPDEETFYISNLLDGSSWEALDFDSAESAPDGLTRVISCLGYLWLLGERTTEIWSNTGDADFPFRRLSNAVLQYGIEAAHSALVIEDSLFWVGKTKEGTGIVYRTNGFTPQRISTPAIERAIQKAATKEDIRAWSFQQDGHTFYVITGGGLETSLVYDLSIGEWVEWSYLDEQGDHTPHLGIDCAFAFGKHIIGDRRNGKLYEMSLDYYDDAGDEIASDRIFAHIAQEDQRVRYNRLNLLFEPGVGLQSGQGSDPKVMVRLSKDHSRTWTGWFELSLGKVGKYQTKAVLRRLGVYEQLTIQTRVTDPVKRAFIGAFLS